MPSKTHPIATKALLILVIALAAPYLGFVGWLIVNVLWWLLWIYVGLLLGTLFLQSKAADPLARLAGTRRRALLLSLAALVSSVWLGPKALIACGALLALASHIDRRQRS